MLNNAAAPISIDGGSGGVILDGNAASSIFRVTKGTTATLADLTIENGVAVNGGSLTTTTARRPSTTAR